MITNNPANYLSALAVLVTLEDISRTAAATATARDAYGYDSTDFEHATDAMACAYDHGLTALSMAGLTDSAMDDIGCAASAILRAHSVNF